MAWTCYGFLDQCRVGNAYFRSSTDGLCLNDAELERYNGVTPFRIVFCAINIRSLAHPHRHVTGWRDGRQMWKVVMPDTWDHIELTYDMMADGIWEFKLQDSDTSEVLCSRMIGLNKDPIYEEEIPDEDVGEDVIDYDKIKEDMIDVENNLMDKIKYLDLMNDIDRNKDNKRVVDRIDNQTLVIDAKITGVESSALTNYQAIQDWSTDLWVATQANIEGITNKIDGLGFPTIGSIKETFISAASEIADRILERVWDEIERRYNK